jgi:hypothetical protein
MSYAVTQMQKQAQTPGHQHAMLIEWRWNTGYSWPAAPQHRSCPPQRLVAAERVLRAKRGVQWCTPIARLASCWARC